MVPMTGDLPGKLLRRMTITHEQTTQRDDAEKMDSFKHHTEITLTSGTGGHFWITHLLALSLPIKNGCAILLFFALRCGGR